MNTYPDQKWFEECLDNKELVEQLKKIKLIITDIDGSLTDDTLYFHPDLTEVKGFSVLDGFGTAHAIKRGMKIAFLSGKTGNILEHRAKQLGIPENLCILGKGKDKIKYVTKLQETCGITKQETILFGNDILDVETKPAVQFFVVPQSSAFYVKKTADMVVPCDAGYGSFRLLLDLVLYVQNNHFAQNTLKAALKK